MALLSKSLELLGRLFRKSVNNEDMPVLALWLTTVVEQICTFAIYTGKKNTKWFNNRKTHMNFKGA